MNKNLLFGRQHGTQKLTFLGLYRAFPKVIISHTGTKHVSVGKVHLKAPPKKQLKSEVLRGWGGVTTGEHPINRTLLIGLPIKAWWIAAYSSLVDAYIYISERHHSLETAFSAKRNTLEGFPYGLQKLLKCIAARFGGVESSDIRNQWIS